MKTFLDSVAADMLQKYGADLSRVAVVFPNKRASLFLNASLVEQSDKPVWAPTYITISDLFRAHTPLAVADPIKLVADLHKSFCEVTGGNETLDHFYGWGQLLLADFDDLDKNMADPAKVFANVRDIHELDDVSYLTEEQLAIISRFFSNFSEDHNSELKRRFLSLWCKFHDIYRAFNERLERQGLAYEGALYRRVATDETVSFRFDRYLFVGFNVLQQVEQRLFARLQKQGRAAFYWDFDQYYMPTKGRPDNEAGHYVASYLQAFPNELDNTDAELYANFAQKKSITYINAPTESAQAHYISKWLRDNPQRIADGKRTAIVLCDEKLLKTAIHCLPDEVAQVNITTGYPLSQSPFSSFMAKLIELRTQGYSVSSGKFRLKAVVSVLSHPYSSYVSGGCSELLMQITDPPCFYPTSQQLAVDEGLKLLFGPLAQVAGQTFPAALIHWLGQVLKAVAAGVGKETATDPLFQESLFKTYTLVNRLDGLMAQGDLEVDAVTLQRLLTQLIQSTSIPFHGEPAVGLQVMGVLETRNLDFDHVLLLSCNDGNMPRGVGDTSFIPYGIRKAYGLTTVDNKVAIYAYYFHRLLQRATDVTIAYNGTASNSQTGEMSRFMQQMLVESPHAIRRERLRLGQDTTLFRAKEIEKNDATIGRLLRRFDLAQSHKKPGESLLTPTAINTYMRCPVRFFYKYACDLRELDDVADEDMAHRVFGNVFHAAAEIVYKKMMGQGTRITTEALDAVLKTKVDVELAVDEAFAKELFKVNQPGHRPEYNGLQLISREVIVAYLRRLLEIDRRLAPFDIVALEGDVAEEMEVDAGTLHFKTTVGGRIDRLDRVTVGGVDCIRVIDYKTGMASRYDLKSIEDVFSPDKLDKHSDYYLQTFVYSRIVRDSAKYNPKDLPVSPALLFIQNAVGEGYDPTLTLDKTPVRDIRRYDTEMRQLLKEKVEEIFNPAEPFMPTQDGDACATCPYVGLCKFFCN